MVTTTEALAQAVKHQMQAKGWNVQDLARETKITEAALYRSLAGITDWPLTRVFKVADALGINAVELIQEAHAETLDVAA